MASLALLLTLPTLQLVPTARSLWTPVRQTTARPIYARLSGRVPREPEPDDGDLVLFERPIRRRSRRAAPTGRAIVSRSDAGTLNIVVPPSGFGMENVMAGAFATGWFSIVGSATLTMAGPGMLFMLPFWAAGAVVAKQAVVDPTSSVSISIGRFGWSVEQKVAGVAIRSRDGPTDELRGAGADVVAYVNGVPQTALRLYDGTGLISLGVSLSQDECDSLADEINRHLDELDGEEDGVAKKRV
eukprot:scaffold838_cov107-Isochrysis_galbana.AAC.2